MENKIPFYNIINYLMIGAIFVFNVSFLDVSIIEIFKDKVDIISSLKEVNVFLYFGMFYLLGTLISRVGSLFVEKVSKKLKIIYWDYNSKKYNEVKKKHSIMYVLHREYNLYRNYAAMFIILTLWGCLLGKWLLSFIYLILILLTFFSMRKYTKKIVDLMK